MVVVVRLLVFTRDMGLLKTEPSAQYKLRGRFLCVGLFVGEQNQKRLFLFLGHSGDFCP